MKNIMKLFSILSLVILISVGCNSSPETDAKNNAKEFLTEFYTADTDKIDKYDALMKIDVSQPSFYETMKSNDKKLISLTTEDEYDGLVSNRTNIIYAKGCSIGGYTLQVTDISFSKNAYDIKENKAGYNYKVKLKFISNKDKSEHPDTVTGYIALVKKDNQWKVLVFKTDTVPDLIKENQH